MATSEPDNENRQAEIASLNAIGDAMRAVKSAMEAQTREIEKIGTKVDDVNIRLVRIEEQKHGRDIDRLTKALDETKMRLQTLELSRAQFQGAGTLATWVRNFAPWAAAIIIMLVSYSGFTKGQP